MQNLPIEAITAALDDNGESIEGAVAIEATVQELAELGVGTCCGYRGNQVFKALASKGFKRRVCRGWYCAERNQQEVERLKKMGMSELGGCAHGQAIVIGMFHIKIKTEKTARQVEKIASDAGGSLRFNGISDWPGFMEFEIE